MHKQLLDVAEIVDDRINSQGDKEVIQYQIRRKGVLKPDEQWYSESYLSKHQQLLENYLNRGKERESIMQQKSIMGKNEDSNKNGLETLRARDKGYQKNNIASRSDLYFEDDEELDCVQNEKMIELDSRKSKCNEPQHISMNGQEDEMIDLKKSEILPRNIKVDSMIECIQVIEPAIKLVEEPIPEKPTRLKQVKRELNFRLNKRLERRKLAVSRRPLALSYFMTLEAQLESGTVLEDEDESSSVTYRSSQVSDSQSANLIEPSSKSSSDQPPISKLYIGENKQPHVIYIHHSLEDNQSSCSFLSSSNKQQSSFSKGKLPQIAHLKKLDGTKPCVVSIHGEVDSRGQLQNPWFTIYEDGEYRSMSRQDLLSYNPEMLSDYYQNKFLYGQSYKPVINSPAKPQTIQLVTPEKKAKGENKKQKKKSTSSDNGEDSSI